MKDYFSHDYYARTDPKMIGLMMRYGVEGIGCFWCIVEMLYEQGGYLKLSEYERITFELRVSKDVVNWIILDSNLFENDGKIFWSQTILARLKERADKCYKAKKSITERWERVKKEKSQMLDNQIETESKNTNVIRTYNDSNTRKGKERKGKEINITTKVDNIKRLSLDFVDESFLEDFKTWLDYKKEKKQNYKSQKQIEILYKKILELSDNDPSIAKKIIEQSIANNWAGLFELKNTNQNGTNNNRFNQQSTPESRKKQRDAEFTAYIANKLNNPEPAGGDISVPF